MREALDKPLHSCAKRSVLFLSKRISVGAASAVSFEPDQLPSSHPFPVGEHPDGTGQRGGEYGLCGGRSGSGDPPGVLADIVRDRLRFFMTFFVNESFFN